MKKPEISFRVFDGSGPLSIYWTDGPYGDALESTSGRGVAWISPSGDTLGVEFDDVQKAKDHQELVLTNGETVTVDVVKGKVKVHRSKIGPASSLAVQDVTIELKRKQRSSRVL